VTLSSIINVLVILAIGLLFFRLEALPSKSRHSDRERQYRRDMCSRFLSLLVPLKHEARTYYEKASYSLAPEKHSVTDDVSSKLESFRKEREFEYLRLVRIRDALDEIDAVGTELSATFGRDALDHILGIRNTFDTMARRVEEYLNTIDPHESAAVRDLGRNLLVREKLYPLHSDIVVRDDFERAFTRTESLIVDYLQKVAP
jgi:hypothetical protein